VLIYEILNISNVFHIGHFHVLVISNLVSSFEILITFSFYFLYNLNLLSFI